MSSSLLYTSTSKLSICLYRRFKSPITRRVWVRTSVLLPVRDVQVYESTTALLLPVWQPWMLCVNALSAGVLVSCAPMSTFQRVPAFDASLEMSMCLQDVVSTFSLSRVDAFWQSDGINFCFFRHNRLQSVGMLNHHINNFSVTPEKTIYNSHIKI